ncbi:MAG: 2-oxoglutarate dehydrogenase complex dihydrolipoyllysine-residue succinyltransferase [Gammaproteobacteria bacterium]|nr:2-oxoglutarate dehydrogenase complex dihydrolipoyllysine-residue succinyltransferase [Gammaproteobacteria bacterium]
MSLEIKVPALPESVADATLVAWHKQPGDAVARDENLADLETDKVMLEVPAPAAGVLREIRVASGATVKAGELLAVLEEGAAGKAAAATAPPGAATARPAAAVSAPGGGAGGGGATPRLGPAARRVADEQGLDPQAVAAASRDGRVASKSDLQALAATPASQKASPRPAAPAAPGGAPPAATLRVARAEQRVPMTRLRARIAERLVQAQQTQAMLTTFNEVDLTAVMELRARHKEAFEKKHGVKLGFMSFFVKAAIEGLRRFPVLNASVEGSDIVYHEYFDIGVAVSIERGLLVPVLRDAEQLDFAGVERAIAAYANKARDGSIALEELTGGTFTITNGGVFGSLLSTPIVNAPQSAILGMHKTQQRPVAVAGEIRIRPMMYLAVSYDHRIIDGREAVQFLVTIKDCLEDPGRLLLGV